MKTVFLKHLGSPGCFSKYTMTCLQSPFFYGYLVSRIVFLVIISFSTELEKLDRSISKASLCTVLWMCNEWVVSRSWRTSGKNELVTLYKAFTSGFPGQMNKEYSLNFPILCAPPWWSSSSPAHGPWNQVGSVPDGYSALMPVTARLHTPSGKLINTLKS